MAGLLDAFGDENARFNLGLLAAAAPRFDGANDGQRIMEALQGVDSWKQKQAQAKMQQMQMEAYQAQAEQAKQEREQRARISAGIGQFFKQGQPALAPLMGDASSGILPSNGRAAVAPSFDANGAASFLAQQGDYNGALGMMDKFKPAAVKLKNVEQMRDPQTGQLVNVALYENGETKVLPYGVKPDIQILGMGDRQQVVDKNAVQGGESFRMGQSPDSKASNAVAWANHGLSRERLNFDRAGGAEGAKPQLVDGQWVYKPDAQNPQGRVVPVAGIADKPLNESQGAATNFGNRALQAHQLLSALEEKGAGQPGNIKRFMTAATPGLGMGLDESVGTMTNWTQSKAQQSAEQAQRNFITAVLRKESGASISPGEYSTAAQIYFPQPNDDAETRKQKAQTRESAIEGLKMQAGPGAKYIGAKNTGGASGDFGGGFADPSKESRYQEWKRRNGG